MALTLDTEPSELVFARNPVLWRLRSTTDDGDPYAAQGASDYIIVGSVTMLADGTTLTLSHTSPDSTMESVTFTAVASPTAEGEIPDDTFSGTPVEYWRAVAAIIQAHHRIGPFLTVIRLPDGGGSKLVAQARSTEEGWAVEWDCSVGFTNGPAGATTDQTPPNYRVVMEVFAGGYGSGNFSRVAQLEGLPDQQGYLWFDLSGILSSVCRGTRTEPMVPAWDTAEPVLCDNLRRYYVRYTEEYGDPVETQPWQYSGLKRCIDGGVSQRVFAESDYLGGLNASNCYFTWMPDGKRIGMNDPEWLPWWNHESTTKQVVLQVVAYDIDNGTAGTAQYAYTSGPIDVEAGATLLLPVRPSTLEDDLGTAFPSDTYKIVVRVVLAGTESGTPTYLSPARTYYLDRTYYESRRFLQYLNGFGCPETQSCTGTWSHDLSVSRQTATRVLLPDANQFATDSYQYGADFVPTLTYRTGYVRKGEAETLQDLLIAGEVYDVSADGYIPLRLTGERWSITDTQRALHAYELPAVARLSMRNYSKVTVTPPADANAWQEPGGAYWFDTLTIPWQLP